MAARDDWPGNLFADKRAFESNFMRFLSFALVFFFSCRRQYSSVSRGRCNLSKAAFRWCNFDGEFGLLPGDRFSFFV